MGAKLPQPAPAGPKPPASPAGPPVDPRRTSEAAEIAQLLQDLSRIAVCLAGEARPAMSERLRVAHETICRFQAELAEWESAFADLKARLAEAEAQRDAYLAELQPDPRDE